MAFIEFHQAFATGLALASVPASAPEVPFDRLELSALALARRDGLWSLTPLDGLDRMFKVLFGIVRANRLADPRLEALRRFAVLARHGRAAMALPSLVASGFSAAQGAAALRLVGAR